MTLPRIGFPWLTLSFEWKLSNPDRIQKLAYRTDHAATEAVEDDEQLWTRYRRAGVDAVQVALTLVDPGAHLPPDNHRPAPPSQWGAKGYTTGLIIEASRWDRPALNEDEFDAWLAIEIRGLLESWRRLTPVRRGPRPPGPSHIRPYR